jgi:endoglucanase
MALNTMEILKQLCETPGPSGSEELVIKQAQELLEPYMDKTWIDALGNLIGVKKCGKQGAKKLLIDAHIDEIGFVITEIEEGFLKFSALGGLDARLLPAAGVTIMAEHPLDGVICVLPPHILKPEDTAKITKIEEMYIDVGLSQTEAERRIPIGTPGVLTSSTRALGKDAVCSKALDNRAGFLAILTALEQIKNVNLDVDLYLTASVQDEVGARGAGTAANAISPDYCIVVDTATAETPDVMNSNARGKAGDGVVVARGPNMNRAFTDRILQLAKEKQIKHQLTVMPNAMKMSSAREIQISQTGVVTAFIAIPVKYKHSANEVVRFDDIDSTTMLLSETIKAMKGA